MRILFKIIALLFVLFVTACGGGGGSAGNPGGVSPAASNSSTNSGTNTAAVISVGTTPTVTVTSTITLSLRDASNAPTTFISGNTINTASALVLDADGKPIVSKLVTFAADPTLATLSPASGTVLTNASGVASVQISAASITASGASTLKASVLVGSATFVGIFDYQILLTSQPNPIVGSTPTVTLELRDPANALTTSISGGGVSTASAKLVDSTGKPVVNRLVTFVSDPTLVKLSPATGTALTNANGIASIQISAASLSVSGASTLKANAIIAASAYSAALDFQISATNLSLRNLNFSASTPLAAYDTRVVTVEVLANGTPVGAPVQVTFSAGCGTIGPTTANTNSAGVASTTYKADSISCAGSSVNIAASTVGATPLSGQLSVLPTAATNIQFVSTLPAVIFLRDSGAATQAVVTFKVVDAAGNPQPNQVLRLSLVNSAPGVSLNVLNSSAEVTKTSDISGNVSVAVFSGTVPTPVQVRAMLDINTKITATSGVLAIAVGRPVQSAASIASGKASLEGFSIDGDTTPVTLSLADRQGNPVPDGTVVNFVTQSGVMIPPTCVVTGGTSQCVSVIRTQGTRPVNNQISPLSGRVSILAYVQGEEDFVDTNFNNVYDFGEPFTDLGNAYRSDANDRALPSDNLNTSNLTYRTGEFSVPRAGASICPANAESSRPGTCDGVWGANEVRKQHVVIFATSGAVVTNESKSTSQISFTLSDQNGNSVPTGSVLTGEKLSGNDDCVVKKVTPSLVGNSLDPALVVISLDKCVSGSIIGFSSTTPLTKTVTSKNFKLP